MRQQSLKWLNRWSTLGAVDVSDAAKGGMEVVMAEMIPPVSSYDNNFKMMLDRIT
jgi:hypothetical protein